MCYSHINVTNEKTCQGKAESSDEIEYQHKQVPA